VRSVVFKKSAGTGNITGSKHQMLNPEKAVGYLSEDYTDDEVGILALEFDAYSQRLQALIQREGSLPQCQSRMRTPLALLWQPVKVCC